jgi:predicted O-methyltransferase YrrM
MVPVTKEDIFDLLLSYTTVMGLSAAMELGLFWLLAEEPQSARDVAQALGIPGNRAGYLLQLLETIGLLERRAEGYISSRTAQAAIVNAYSRDAWAFLAREARDRLPAVRDLAVRICEPGSTWEAQGLSPPDYFEQMVADPEKARRFTRVLCEFHQVLAEELASTVDLTGVRRLLDVGGGSGVVSLAFLRRNPELRAVVIDIEDVCAAGREIAAEYPESDRITYLAADFMCDELPGGFDLVLQCDAGVYGKDFYHRLRATLNAEGRIVVVDQFAPENGVAPARRLHWAFLSSMANPEAAFPTSFEVKTELMAAGFSIGAEHTLSDGWMVIDARY